MPAISRQLSSQLLRISTLALAAALGAPIAHAQTVINNQTVTVPPSSISPGSIVVGSTGTGELNIVSTGVVTTNLSTLGESAGSTGTVNVSGTGHWNSNAITVGAYGTGTLNVTAGGGVTGYAGASIGRYAGSSGTVLLSGAGSTWTSSADVTVGEQGTGSMTVSEGAELTATNIIVGSSTGSTGTFLLTGSDSEVTLSSSLYVGYDGDGTFNVTDGATLTVTGGIYVGYSEGQGVFNVSGGSTVISGSADFGYYSDAGQGTANISGVGTTWTINGSLTLGDEGGAGEMNITDGAHVSVSGNLQMGVYDEGITRGDLLISGSGSQLTVAGNAYIGYERPAIVVVSNGGYLQTTGDAVISGDTSAPSTVTVTGAGSVWDSGDVIVGEYGVGQLNITNGGVVNGSGDAQVGYYGSGSSVTISGSGSQWNLGNYSLDVGYYADATLTVTNNAVLTAGDITLGYGTNGHGVANVTSGGKIYSGDVTLGSYGYPMSGTMNISGAGSEWHVDGGITAVEDYGAADINVTDKGLLTVTDYLYLGSYGSHVDDIARMTVSGAGTRVEIGGSSFIGYGAVASLTVTDNAQFTTHELLVGPVTEGKVTISNGAAVTATLATSIGANGTLIFGAAANDAATASGTLSTPTVTFTSGSGGTIVFNHTNNLTFDAALVSDSAGYGDVQLLAGTTTFTTGTGAYSGTIEVTGGKAVFNADVGGDVTVSGSGVVGGSGTIGSLDAQSGGTVSPGNSPGTLTVQGDVSFASGSTYVVEVSGAVSDLIAAGGTATLSGGTVKVSGSPSLMQYTILTATGGVTGTFDGVDSTSAFILYSLDYDPNNVYLLIDGYNSLTTAARTPNQYAVARALDQFPADNPLYTAIISGSVAGAQQAFNALSGEIHASVGTALADDSRYVREAITGRLIQAYYGGAGAGGGQPIVLASAAPQDVATVDTSTRMSLGAGYGASREAPAGGHNLAYWSRAFGAWGQYDSNGNAATTDRNLGGFVTGVDGAVGGGWRAGLATGYLYTGLDVGSERYSSAQINSYVLGGYAGGAIGAFAFRSGGTWTWNGIDSSRNVIFPGFSEYEKASYNGDVGQLFGELAYPMFTHGGVVEPFAGLAYVHVGTDSFTESGSIAGLTSGGLNMNLGYGTLGARAGTTVVWGATTVIPHASAAWQYAFGDTTPEQALAFSSTGIGMGIGGVPLAQNSALVEIGADAVIAHDATLGLSYIGQYSGDFNDSGLRGRFNWKF